MEDGLHRRRSWAYSSKFRLVVRQQPARARLCSFKEENETIDRRPVDPPPVVELQGLDDNLNLLEATKYFIRAAIVQSTPSIEAPSDFAAIKTPTGADATAGETLQTPERLKHLDGTSGALCIFAKLSVRMPGIFRLKFTLYETSDEGITEITSTVSDQFEVFSPKLFRGMKESTPLTRHLAAQGLKVKLRTDTAVGRQSESRRVRTHSVQGSQTPRESSPPHTTRSPKQPYPDAAEYPYQRGESSTARPARPGGDDGFPSMTLMANKFDWTPPPSSDLSVFSLSALRDRDTPRPGPSPMSNASSSWTSSTSRTFTPGLTSASISRSQSPYPATLPPLSHLNIGPGDDGIPLFGSSSFAAPRLSNLLTSPRPILPPLRALGDDPGS